MASMTPRERIPAVLNHQPADIVPFDISGTKTTSINVTADNNLKDDLGISAPTVWGNYRFQRVHASEAMSRFFDVDVRRVGELYPETLPPEVSAKTQVDEWGVKWTRSKGQGSYMPSVYDTRQAYKEFETITWSVDEP